MLKSVEITCWIDPDLEGHGGYSASYAVMQERTPLYSVALNRQGGFYGISEFVSEAGAEAFVLEQVNNSGRARVAVFDKSSGEMLGTIGERKVFDAGGEVLFTLEKIKDRPDFTAEHFHDVDEDDWLVASSTGQWAVLAHLRVGPGVLQRWRRWLDERKQSTPSPIMRVDLLLPAPADERLFYALAVVLHSRRGVILPTDVQDLTHTPPRRNTR